MTLDFSIRRRWRMLALVGVLVGLVGCDSDSDGNGNGTGPSEPATPAQPTVTFSGSAVQVSWASVSGATSYIVERDVVGDSGGFVEVASGVTSTSYTDTNLEDDRVYLYRIRAVNDAGTSSASDPAEADTGDLVQEEVLSGTITNVRQLDADVVYLMRGLIIVEDGGELRIPAGTLLLGDIETAPTALIVRQGGRLYSEGTADAPVVFTSSAPEGERRRGDWGGVVLNGRSICNFPAGDCIGEGNSGPYGGDMLDDNSGKIVYTRIEFAGFEVSFGSELNILTMNGVGSGTEIHHVQTHYGLDDGFEWFGGTVDLKYGLATGISDDSFDYSTGWQGRGQFWIAQQDPQDADNGYEVDGNEDNFDAEPFTDPMIYNVTLIGKGPNGSGGAAGESTRGLLLRRGTAGDIYNHIVMGFGTAGIDIDNQETVDRVNSGDMTIQNSIISSNARNFDTDDDGIDEEAIVMQAGWNNRTVDPGLADPFDRVNPDFRPSAGSAALEGFAVPPDDGFFDEVDFVGGVGPDDEWYAGWSTTAQN